MSKALLHNEDPGMKQALLRALEQWGYEGIEIPEAHSIYVATAIQSPDVLIIGIRGCGQEQLEALREIKSDPNTNPVPVIILTAQEPPDAEQEQLWRQHGAFDVLSNRWTFEQLRSRLQAAVLNRRRNLE